jgi:hypothetical protein
MSRLAPFAFLALILLAMPACNQTTVASNSSGLQRTGYNSAVMPPADMSAQTARQARPMGRSYDADCRARYGVDTIGYSACLQNLPASALAANNR